MALSDHISRGAHMFVDESRRRDRYLLVAVVVDPADLARTRRRLREQLLPNQRELHMKREAPARRRHVADHVARMNLRGCVYSAAVPGKRDEEAARGACLSVLAADACIGRAGRMVLDGRAPERDKQDERIIRRILGRHPAEHRLTYEHIDSTLEPLIWAADIVAWSIGAGGDWPRRISPIVAGIVDCSEAEP